MGAIDIFNMAICPSLLANCGTWVNISKETVKKLDALQHLFVKVLLRLPSSTVLPAYRAETGLRGMLWRIWEEKLLVVKAIKQMDDKELAKEVFKQQMDMDWPGLSQEASVICKTIGLPDICKEEVQKEEIQEAIFYHHYKQLKEEVAAYEKLDGIKNDDLRTAQPYMKENCPEHCRVAFRLRTRQFVCRANMSRMYGGVLWCHNCSQSADQGPDGGPAPVESQQHIEICEAFRHLRKDRDIENSFSDKVKYFMDVMVERTKQK